MKILAILILCVCLAVLVLPLRSVTESSYEIKSQDIGGGSLMVQFDPTFSRKVTAYWFDGLQGHAPYRIRLLFKPRSPNASNFLVESFKIRGGDDQMLLELPPQSAANVQYDSKREAILIVGYLDVELDAERATIDLVVKINGISQSTRIELKKIIKHRLVHAGWEALKGV